MLTDKYTQQVRSCPKEEVWLDQTPSQAFSEECSAAYFSLPATEIAHTGTAS